MNQTTFVSRPLTLRTVFAAIKSAMSTPTRAQTNVECVVDIMQFSKDTPLTQLFVMDALKQQANRVALMSDAEADYVSTPVINGRAWREIARGVKAKLEQHDRAPTRVAYKGDGDEY